MKNKICLFALLIALPVLAFAQESDKDKPLTLFEDFTEGSIYFKTGATEHAMLNYDTSSEKFLFMAGGEIMELTNTRDIAFINIKGRLFENIKGDIFYERITTGGAYDLYVLWRSKVISKGKKGAYGGYSQLSNISTASSVTGGGRTVHLDPTKVQALSIEPVNTYLININDTFKAFSSEKSLLKLFKGHESEIKSFLKDNDINFGEVEDMKKVVAYVSQFLS